MFDLFHEEGEERDEVEGGREAKNGDADGHNRDVVHEVDVAKDEAGAHKKYSDDHEELAHEEPHLESDFLEFEEYYCWEDREEEWDHEVKGEVVLVDAKLLQSFGENYWWKVENCHVEHREEK